MEYICGVIGKSDPAAVRDMAKALNHRGRGCHVLDTTEFTLASSCPIGDDPCVVDGPIAASEILAACNSARKPGSLKLSGPFAAVARVKADWWLLRDRLGIKPLYYFQDGDSLYFASELKALLKTGRVTRNINFAGVEQYLSLRCVPGCDSIIKDVKRVQPGHVLVWARAKLTATPFAEVDWTPRQLNRDQAADQLRDRLRTTVHETASSTLLWSAGIDCASVAAFKPGADAVFVTLKSAWQDEEWRAKESARLMKVNLRAVKAPRVSEEMFSRVAYYLDEPVADASVLPLWMIAEQTAQALDGDPPRRIISAHGADELLGGYPRYRILQQARTARNLVPVNLLTTLLPSLPPNTFVRRGGKYLASLRDNVRAYLSLTTVFDQAERNELYTGPMREAVKDSPSAVSIVEPHFTHEHLMQNLLALDINVSLPDLLLTECDRLMAAHGLELEFPYLHDSMVDFAAGLPPKVKYGVQSKPLLRQAMKGLLPGRVRLRARRGFRVPQSGPSLRVIEEAAAQILTRERVEESAMFRWPCVSQIIASRGHNVYRRRQFWSLLMFFAWYREFMEG